MFEWILAIIGIVGFGLAGYWDLKSTEFPDWLPYSIIILALAVRAVFAFLLADWSILTDSIIVGIAFLGLGLGMYFTKQWGDGDAWLMGALGFLFPSLPAASDLTAASAVVPAASPFGFAYASSFPFPLAMIFNFFLIAFVYIIAYSLALSLIRPEVCRGFIRAFKPKLKNAVILIGGTTAAYFIFLIAMFLHFGLVPPSPFLVASFPLMIAFVVVFSHYGKYIEKNLFKRRIPVSKLRVGDVPVGGQWRVLSHKEISVLKRRGGSIWIKEGVRFAPVFVIALVVTLLFGDVFSLIFGLI